MLSASVSISAAAATTVRSRQCLLSPATRAAPSILVHLFPHQTAWSIFRYIFSAPITIFKCFARSSKSFEETKRWGGSCAHAPTPCSGTSTLWINVGPIQGPQSTRELQGIRRADGMCGCCASGVSSLPSLSCMGISGGNSRNKVVASRLFTNHWDMFCGRDYTANGCAKAPTKAR